MAFNEVIPRDDPNKCRHLKPLYVSAHVEGVPISKVFVDCGATVNVLPCSLMKKLAKTKEDLIPSDVVMSSFVGDKSKTVGVLPLKITVADQTRVAAFYVVESSVDYNILLGCDWIHQAGCIPSSLFQPLYFWDGQKVSIHPADKKPFETNAVQARIYDDDVGWVVLTGHDASGRPTWTTAQKRGSSGRVRPAGKTTRILGGRIPATEFTDQPHRIPPRNRRGGRSDHRRPRDSTCRNGGRLPRGSGSLTRNKCGDRGRTTASFCKPASGSRVSGRNYQPARPKEPDLHRRGGYPQNSV
ncbi:unnamed protein product [Prunus brigantina]